MPSPDPEKRRQQMRRWQARNREKLLVYAKEWRAQNPEKEREYGRRKRKQNREQIRAGQACWRAANREKLRAQAAARRLANPEKHRAQVAASRARNPERARQRTRKYLKTHPEIRRKHSEARRARKRGASTSEPFDRQAIIERDGSRCHICGKRVASTEITLDHLVPLSRGGEHSALNVRVAHARCNSSRGPGRTPAQLLLV